MEWIVGLVGAVCVGIGGLIGAIGGMLLKRKKEDDALSIKRQKTTIGEYQDIVDRQQKELAQAREHCQVQIDRLNTEVEDLRRLHTNTYVLYAHMCSMNSEQYTLLILYYNALSRANERCKQAGLQTEYVPEPPLKPELDQRVQQDYNRRSVAQTEQTLKDVAKMLQPFQSAGRHGPPSKVVEGQP